MTIECELISLLLVDVMRLILVACCVIAKDVQAVEIYVIFLLLWFALIVACCIWFNLIKHVCKEIVDGIIETGAHL